MLVLPKLADRRKSRGVLSSLDTLGRSAIQTVTGEIGYVPGSGVLTDAAYEASKKAQERLVDKSQKESYLYYLLPVSEIFGLREDKILLDKKGDDYELYMDMKATQSDVAFFNDEMYRDPESYIRISLNIVTIRGMNVQDPNNNKARIVDAMFNQSEGLITHLVVATVGKGALRLVDVGSVNFAEMTVPKALTEFPEIMRSSSDIPPPP